MNKNFWIGVAVLVLVIIVGYYVLHQKPKETGATITIGSVLGLTGDAQYDSLNIKRGMDLAQADLAAQGVNVDIKYEDDSTDSSKTVLAAQRIISLYHPQAFEGFTWDFLLSAAAPLIESSKIPTWSPANPPEAGGTQSPYIFFGTPRNSTKVQPTADFLKKNNLKRVAIVVQDSTWGLEMIDDYTKAAQLAGATVVLVDKSEYGQESTVFPATATKVKQNKADVVLWSGGATGIDVFLPKLEQQGVDVPVIGEVALQDEVRNGAVQKTMKSGWYIFNTNDDPDFVTKFTAKYGTGPGYGADIAYDNLMVLVEAIRNTDGSSDQILAYLHGGKVQYKGYSTTSFAISDDGGLKDGAWVLEPVTAK